MKVMQHTITIEYGEDLLFSLGLTSAQFAAEAQFLLTAKLYEMGRLSSGKAAKLCGNAHLVQLCQRCI